MSEVGRTTDCLGLIDTTRFDAVYSLILIPKRRISGFAIGTRCIQNFGYASHYQIKVDLLP